jgi:hypothetical protein
MNYGGQGDSSGQIVTGLGIVALLFIVCITSEVLYKTVYDAQNRFQTLIDYSANSKDMSITIHQDGSKYSDAKTIGMSMNERTGIEFSYSFFMFVLPATFDSTDVNTFKHVFHKGFATPWPLMGPGIFMNATTNTMRVIMNAYNNPYTYADVTNIPIQKWVHVTLNCVNNGLDIFVNGGLAKRISFENTLPYQNFQDLILFSTVKLSTLGRSGLPAALGTNQFNLTGAFSGTISNLIYARYALSMGEIQNLMAKGPSTKIVKSVMEQPPYLADDWWANQ